MSLHFSANQYQKEFEAKKLQNWEVPREHQKRPRGYEGFTQIIATNRGHLLPSVLRGKVSPWGTYVGTWDIPLKIPGNKTLNPTARSIDAQARLRNLKDEGDFILSGKLKDQKIPTPTQPMPSNALPPALIPETTRSGALAPSPGGSARKASPAPIKTPSPMAHGPIHCSPSPRNFSAARPASQVSQTPTKSPVILDYPSTMLQ